MRFAESLLPSEGRGTFDTVAVGSNEEGGAIDGIGKVESERVIRPWVQEVLPAPEPAAVLARASRLPHPLLLESVPSGGPGGRYSFLSADPFRILTEGEEGDPFAALRRLLVSGRMETLPGLPPFQGGVAGYLGFELHRFLEPGILLPPRDHRHPELWLGAFDWVLAWDHVKDRCWVFSTGLPEGEEEDRSRRARRRLELALSLAQEAGEPNSGSADQARTGAEGRASGDARSFPSAPGPDRPTSGPSGELLPGHSDHPVPAYSGLFSTFSRDGYLAAVERVRSYIRAGDAFQVNLSQRLTAPSSLGPLAAYRRLREHNPASYAGVVATRESWILSASPECFLRVRGREVETRPIKGTAPRSRDPEEDRRLGQGLQSSEKDRAENVMIVDLLRNDLSRVCEDHGIEVPELCVLESHPSVHHLVSTVRGRLRPDVDLVDLLKATFPGGSITGAPKIRAMEIIGELEPVRRGVYTGSVGYLGFDGSADLNIAIRTVVLESGRAHLSVGGGILLDSDPDAEYEETLHKGRRLLEALGMKREGDSATGTGGREVGLPVASPENADGERKPSPEGGEP